jgi:putative transposase
MTPDSELPKPFPSRNRPVHQPAFSSGNRAVIVFVTVCTKDRTRLLATPAMHQAILDAWKTADHWIVGRYVILPDHIHLFCAPNSCPPQPLLNWVRFWKSRIAKSIGCGSATLWQKNFWDVQLRRGESYAAKWEYVRSNPVRHRLVSSDGDWPYQGESSILPWHD